jgi:hypothetical protein
MPRLEIIDDCFTISLGFWGGMYWPSRKVTFSKNNLKDVYVDNKMPSCILCRKPVANLPGLLCLGVFYTNGYSEKSELWWFTRKHNAFLNIVLDQGSHGKIILGMSKKQAEEWLCKINNLTKQENGNRTNN